MSTFKFNFSGEKENHIQDESKNEDKIEWLKSHEISLTNQIINLEKIADRAKIFVCGDVEIGHIVIKNNTALQEEESSDLYKMINLAEQEHSDLIAGKYEGGLKIWECTSDLIEYFEEHNQDISFQNKKVLDLGCGPGMLGIYAFMNGSNVSFQDYNKEVIENVTISNVLLNIEEEKESEIKRCRFYCGDWESFNEICDDVFDIILTSETIYNEQNYKKLIDLFCDKLNNSGTIYVAAKTYYFGVGGGTRQFEESIKDNEQLESKVCWKSTEGIQREIIKIIKSSGAK